MTSMPEYALGLWQQKVNLIQTLGPQGNLIQDNLFLHAFCALILGVWHLHLVLRRGE